MNSPPAYYTTERARLELTLRMIQLEARTHTIRECTGLSDDRIRKIYSRYFKTGGGQVIQRRRGKSPQRVNFFVKNARNQLHATTLVYLFCACGLLEIGQRHAVRPAWSRPDVAYGQRLCRAYDAYVLIHPAPALSFEWASNLLRAISRNDELQLAQCGNCQLPYVHDSYEIDQRQCPGCEIQSGRQRRPGAASYTKA